MKEWRRWSGPLLKAIFARSGPGSALFDRADLRGFGAPAPLPGADGLYQKGPLGGLCSRRLEPPFQSKTWVACHTWRQVEPHLKFGGSSYVRAYKRWPGRPARTAVACALDGLTGELFRHRLTPDRNEILAWIVSLPPPAKVVYEAGPPGFGLARFLLSAGIDTGVAAPSKLQRPSGDRVKTDTRDALHLARLLKLGEITAVQVPPVEQEAARDLVRSREDVRGEPHALPAPDLQALVASGHRIFRRAGLDWNPRTMAAPPALRRPRAATDL
ncbi:hypothetical protein ARTHRO9AX_10332 [Arthrobacter sp. 9AX]|nr:transposase [Arthrobacter sp. 9AX]VXB05706.1 hypothetical protein ARTHRO9AX_10332 [Arthrobacter sp. 9AX]